MNEIDYQQLNPIIEQDIIDSFGDWAKDYLHQGEGCYTLVALAGDKPVGFISVYPLQYPEPLECFRDAYIDVLEVAEGYRRRGIASKLIGFTEDWAKEYGYKQIRARSMDTSKYGHGAAMTRPKRYACGMRSIIVSVPRG